jgi:hypothetical protein
MGQCLSLTWPQARTRRARAGEEIQASKRSLGRKNERFRRPHERGHQRLVSFPQFGKALIGRWANS